MTVGAQGLQSISIIHVRHQPASLQLANDFPQARRDRLFVRLDENVGRDRLFVWIRDAGKPFDLAGERLLVQTFHIALSEHVNRTLYEYFYEVGSVLFNRLS